MNRAGIVTSLRSLGWRVQTDEVGDKVAFFDLSDRVIDIIPNVRRYGGDQQFSTMKSLSTERFSAACQHIRHRGEGYTPLIRAMQSFRLIVPEILDDHVRQASEEAIAWAEAQDLDKALRDHAALPTNAPGARPIWHLAALVLLGDVAKLKSYQASFEAGDRLGFVNYVTKDYIDRAVALAEELNSPS
jgi:hypothetical protein